MGREADTKQGGTKVGMRKEEKEGGNRHRKEETRVKGKGGKEKRRGRKIEKRRNEEKENETKGNNGELQRNGEKEGGSKIPNNLPVG
jgi:hypothetical protein